MKVTFHGQPFLNFGGWAATWLLEQLENSEINEIRIAVAWAKRSGLSRLEIPIRAYRAKGGTISAVIGIDEGGATVQGLHLASELFDSVHIFHEPSSRTYHPKVYIASGRDVAQVMVGSNNMTAGGLFSNYEASLVCTLTLAHKEDRILFAQVVKWFESLLSDTNTCKELTPELLEKLISDSRYEIVDEDKSRSDRAGRDEPREGVASDTPAESIFAVSSIPKAPMAPTRRARSERPRVRGPRKPRPATNPEEAEQKTIRRTTVPTEDVLWWKKMSATDAQHPPNPQSHVTGHLKLTKEEFDIDHETFFREVMFAELDWVNEQKKRGILEFAEALFDVIIGGASLGRHSLRISHAKYRAANQGNVPTWLHWGVLRSSLQETDYTKASVVIERLIDGSYKLEIRWDSPAANT